MQRDQPEVARLTETVTVIEEKPKTIGCIQFLWINCIVCYKSDIRIGTLEQGYKQLRHCAGEPAVMPFLEFHRVGEPPYRIAQRTDRELDQYLPVLGIEFMAENTGLPLPDFNADAKIVALGATYKGSTGR